MKKSINLWAFPYPQRMNLEECLRLAKDAGFDGIEDHRARIGTRLMCNNVGSAARGPLLHLIDGRGRVREIYSLGFFDLAQAWADIQGLLRE